MIDIYERMEFYRENWGINIYAYQPNETGYWAHSLECKAKYDTWTEAMIQGIEEASHRITSTI